MKKVKKEEVIVILTCYIVLLVVGTCDANVAIPVFALFCGFTAFVCNLKKYNLINERMHLLSKIVAVYTAIFMYIFYVICVPTIAYDNICNEKNITIKHDICLPTEKFKLELPKEEVNKKKKKKSIF